MVGRSDLPEGQQSKGSSFARSVLGAPGAGAHIEKWDIVEDGRSSRREVAVFTEEGLAAREARVRAEVAEEIARHLESFATGAANARYQESRYLVPHFAAAVAREHAGKAVPSPAGRLDRVWWLHRCVDSNPALTWFSDRVAADVPRPARCPSCGTATNEGWFNVAKIDRLPKE